MIFGSRRQRDGRLVRFLSPLAMVHQGLVDNILASFEPGNSTAELEFQRFATRTSLTMSTIFTLVMLTAIVLCVRR